MSSPNLFQLGEFRLHSGQPSRFKIDCDALTDEDIETCAAMIDYLVPPFGTVYGVPRGGYRLERALKKYQALFSANILIVDDVLTTGESMRAVYREWVGNLTDGHERVYGAVIFARGQVPHWVTPLFVYSHGELR